MTRTTSCGHRSLSLPRDHVELVDDLVDTVKAQRRRVVDQRVQRGRLETRGFKLGPQSDGITAQLLGSMRQRRGLILDVRLALDRGLANVQLGLERANLLNDL